MQALAKMELRVSPRLLDSLAAVALLKISEFNPQVGDDARQPSSRGQVARQATALPCTCDFVTLMRRIWPTASGCA